MQIVWTYGAIRQHQGFGPVWNWSGSTGVVVPPNNDPPARVGTPGSDKSNPSTTGYDKSNPSVTATVQV